MCNDLINFLFLSLKRNHELWHFIILHMRKMSWEKSWNRQASIIHGDTVQMSGSFARYHNSSYGIFLCVIRIHIVSNPYTVYLYT